MYNLADDLAEANNLAEKLPGKAKQFQALLDKIKADGQHRREQDEKHQDEAARAGAKFGPSKRLPASRPLLPRGTNMPRFCEKPDIFRAA